MHVSYYEIDLFAYVWVILGILMLTSVVAFNATSVVALVYLSHVHFKVKWDR
jgi:hypothetical protein